MILKHIKDVTVKKPSKELRKAWDLKHEGDCIVELLVEDVDRYEAVDEEEVRDFRFDCS